jgi:hypothetical protein
MVYPGGEERVALLQKKNELLGELLPKVQQTYFDLERAQSPLLLYYHLAVRKDERRQLQGMLPQQLHEYVFKMLSDFAKQPLLNLPPQLAAELSFLYELATQINVHEHDFKFMLSDWMLEAFQQGEQPNPNNLHGLNPGLIDYIQGRIKEDAALSIGSDTISDSELEKLLINSKQYWLENIRDRPVEEFKVATKIDTLLPYQVLAVASMASRHNPAVFYSSGGLEYREALAQLACEGMTSALDVGTGDGFQLPSLVYRLDDARAIDPIYFETSQEIMQALRNDGKSVVMTKTLLEQYFGEVDVAVVTNGEFMADIEIAARNLARVARQRVVVGVVTGMDHLNHYTLKTSTAGQGHAKYTLESAEPLRWARELKKHYNDVDVLLYGNRTFVIKAEDRKPDIRSVLDVHNI